MKGWVKILIAILVIVVAGFAMWAFFFREKDEVVAYNRVSELIDYKYSTDIDKEIEELIGLDYLYNNKTFVFDENNPIEKNIMDIRTTCLNTSNIIIQEDNVEIYRYQSYLMLEKTTDDIIYAYLPYLKGAKVNKSDKRSIERAVRDCITDMSSISVTIGEIKECQNEIVGTDIELEFLLGKYQNFRNAYRKYLNSSSNLILSMQRYINNNLYGDNIKMDASNMLYDSFARQLNSMTSVDLREEVDRATAIDKVYYKITMTDDWGIDEVFSGYAEYEVLQAYNLLINNYIDDLNYILGESYYVKTEMAKSNSLSKVKIEAQPSVVLVLKALGF